MGEYAEMLLNGVFCETCGEFISAEPTELPQKCDGCFEDELIEAVEQDIWPDGMTHSEWMDVKRKYSDPEEAFRE